jgi:hypothetical protein
MADAGELQEIIAAYLNTRAIFAFDTVADMQAAENLEAGSYAQTLGYYAKGDYGASTYAIVDDELTANGSTIIALDSGLFAVLNLSENVIKCEQFGAYGDGTHDDTASVQHAINYGITYGKSIEFNGQYKVMPITRDDSTKVCLTFSYPNSGLQAPTVELKFNRTSRLFTTSTDDCTLIRWEARNGKIANAILEGVQGKTTLLEMSRTILTSTNYDGWNMDNIFEGIIFRYGKNAITMEGSCYYNRFTNCRIYNCTNGIILQMTYREKQGLAQESSVNRNDFVNVNMNIITNWGIRIEYGETNKFVNVDLEGCGNGIYIDQPRSHQGDFPITPLWLCDNNSFVNVMMEAITNLEWYNRSSATRIIATSADWGDKAQMVALPQVYLGGLDHNTSIERILGMNLVKENKIYPSQLGYSIYSERPFAARGLYDYTVSDNDVINMSVNGTTFDVTKENSNIATSSNSNGFAKSLGNIVHLVNTITFTATTTTDPIRLYFRDNKPWLKAKSLMYGSNDILIPLMGEVGGTRTLLHAVIKPEYIYIYAPAGGWDASSNKVCVNISYFRDGDL